MMRRTTAFGCVAAMALGLLLLRGGRPAGAAGAAEVTLTPPQFWMQGFAAAPQIPLAGDVDGDGRADLLALNPLAEGNLEWARTSATGKPCFPTQARGKFGKDALAA